MINFLRNFILILVLLMTRERPRMDLIVQKPFLRRMFRARYHVPVMFKIALRSWKYFHQNFILTLIIMTVSSGKTRKIGKLLNFDARWKPNNIMCTCFIQVFGRKLVSNETKSLGGLKQGIWQLKSSTEKRDSSQFTRTFIHHSKLNDSWFQSRHPHSYKLKHPVTRSTDDTNEGKKTNYSYTL